MPARKLKQKGGASTDYASLFYAPIADNAQLSRYTLQHINQSPMFNPLQMKTIIPTGTTGIIPTGTFYDSVMNSNMQPLLSGPPIAMPAQFGGGLKSVSKTLYITKSGKHIKNSWIAHVYKFADKHQLSYTEALKHPKVKSTYNYNP